MCKLAHFVAMLSDVYKKGTSPGNENFELKPRSPPPQTLVIENGIH
jgi:hypothetical protein